jgi:hypothetical protein
VETQIMIPVFRRQLPMSKTEWENCGVILQMPMQMEEEIPVIQLVKITIINFIILDSMAVQQDFLLA